MVAKQSSLNLQAARAYDDYARLVLGDRAICNFQDTDDYLMRVTLHRQYGWRDRVGHTQDPLPAEVQDSTPKPHGILSSEHPTAAYPPTCMSVKVCPFRITVKVDELGSIKLPPGHTRMHARFRFPLAVVLGEESCSHTDSICLQLAIDALGTDELSSLPTTVRCTTVPVRTVFILLVSVRWIGTG